MSATAYVVKDGHTLGYMTPVLPGVFCPLASDIHGHDWKNGPVALAPPIDIRPATLEDFERFRVCPRGHIVPLDLGGATVGLRERPDGSIEVVP